MPSHNFKDLTGQVFTRLVVIEQVGRDKWCGDVLWKCRCSCNGKEKIVRTGNLRSGNTKSCGCLSKELARQSCRELGKKQTGSTNPNFKHGHRGYGGKRESTPECSTWQSMIQRCSNPRYENYNGRGISVCERWKNEDGFTNFLMDMGERPAGMTLDRWPNNNGNYEPGNCRWATRSEQNRNRRPFKRSAVKEKKSAA